MEKNINESVAVNLKALREQRKMSLDMLAKLTGVSKSMLGQIERGDANPTISTLWKIANGLKLSFTELITRPETDFEVVRRSSIVPLTESEGTCRNYPIFPFDSSRQFELYCVEFDGGATMPAEAHMAGAQEFITVFSGTLEIHVNGQVLWAKEGDSVRFKADIPHTYFNPGEILCRASMVISYQK